MEYTEYRDKVIELGKEAFDAILNRKRKPCEIKDKTPLMIEYARHGENYFNLKNDDVKFMVVGRAPGLFHKGNGKERELVGKIDCSVIDYITNAANSAKIEHCFDVHYNEEEHLSWIHMTKENMDKGDRYIDSKRFFGFAKKVYLNLIKQEQDIEWYKNICHSNVFKIVPISGGNPRCALRNAQIKEMAEIFKAEIDFYKPTHILIIDGRENSPCWCFGIKEEIERYAKSLGVKIWFSNRPEYKSNEVYNEMFDQIDKDFWTIE